MNMAVITEYISVSTKGRRDTVDITARVQAILDRHNVEDGTAVCFVPGSTAGLTTIEFEPGLRKDISEFLEEIIPYARDYHHHDTWNDDNGSAHLQAALIGPSVCIPVVSGTLTLGTWQQIVVVDCDTRPREREIVVQIVY